MKPESYDALVIPGGRAPEYLRLESQGAGDGAPFPTADKPIAAICHAAQVLAAAQVLKGKKVSAYPACAPEVESAGGIYVPVGMTEALVDGTLVTAPAWPAHPAWLAKFLEVLDSGTSKSQQRGRALQEMR